MVITSKGQVTIPKHIRDQLGLLPECEVIFEIDGEAARIRRAPDRETRGSKLIAHLAGRATSGMSTDEILEHTRSET